MGMLLAMTMAKQREEAEKQAEIPFADETAFIPEEVPEKAEKPVKPSRKPVKRATTRKRTSK